MIERELTSKRGKKLVDVISRAQSYIHLIRFKKVSKFHSIEI